MDLVADDEVQISDKTACRLRMGEPVGEGIEVRNEDRVIARAVGSRIAVEGPPVSVSGRPFGVAAARRHRDGADARGFPGAAATLSTMAFEILELVRREDDARIQQQIRECRCPR